MSSELLCCMGQSGAFTMKLHIAWQFLQCGVCLVFEALLASCLALS